MDTARNGSFRQAFEALNMGVVPGDPQHLLNLTIGGREASEDIRKVLSSSRGRCRVYKGYYGSGKSHHLRLVRSVALNEGWVTAFIEVDPKGADPGKASRFYQAITSELAFPDRSDGSRNEDYFQLIREIRENWSKVGSIGELEDSPWFGKGLEAMSLVEDPESDPNFKQAVQWLFGQISQYGAFNRMVRLSGVSQRVHKLPAFRDTSMIHVHFLVVLHAILRGLGYKGLALVIDEAEHVRRYSGNRLRQARNFLDLLARCARLPDHGIKKPGNDHRQFDRLIPQYWKHGPHFALFVGITEEQRYSDDDEFSMIDVLMGRQRAGSRHRIGNWRRNVRDELDVLTRQKEDVEELHPPSAPDYAKWVETFLAQCAQHLGPQVGLLSDPEVLGKVAGKCREEFEKVPKSECVFRNWTRLAGFVPALLLRQGGDMEVEALVEAVEQAGLGLAGEDETWDDDDDDDDDWDDWDDDDDDDVPGPSGVSPPGARSPGKSKSWSELFWDE